MYNSVMLDVQTMGTEKILAMRIVNTMSAALQRLSMLLPGMKERKQSQNESE